MPGAIVYFDHYSPIGDIVSMVLCLLMLILISETFVDREKSFILFKHMLILVIAGSIFNLLFHLFTTDINKYTRAVLYGLRAAYHLALFSMLFMFVLYVVGLLSLPDKTRDKIKIVSGFGLIGFVIADILGSIFGYSFTIAKDGTISMGFSVFSISYIFYIGIIFYLLLWYRDRIIHQIFRGLLFTFGICVIIQGVQGSFHQTSFTTSIFLFPIITLMYLLHSNPYDVETGAIDEATFDRTIIDSYASRSKLMLLSLHLHEIERQKSFTKDLQFELFHFFNGIVKHGMLFRINGGRLVLVYKIAQNPDYESVNAKLIESFNKLYERFKISFKVVIIESIPEFSLKNDYPALIEVTEEKMSYNTFYTINEEDILSFARRQYIITQLADIAEKNDLDDKRILVYCQPVYNVSSGEYDTAEALMRLELAETGILFPNLFIPIAEQADLIHPISLIILNKTCKIIRQMLDSGFHVHRISVNFSIQELRDDSFCSDIIHIIERNRVPYERIAIELTESRNAYDFNLVKDRINELKGKGIKFYLDDFGTGYSNFDRIMELPFDIIKFDRSLVIESGKDKTSEYMVHTFADMFNKLHYKVLYEGVEDTEDEQRCIRMFAQYLQGYKYSKPIPIEQLTDFFSKAG